LFNTKDVLIVANAIVEWENAFCYNSGDYEQDSYSCAYCGEKTFTMNWQKVEHKLDCPYLVATDMLTGFDGC